MATVLKAKRVRNLRVAAILLQFLIGINLPLGTGSVFARERPVVDPGAKPDLQRMRLAGELIMKRRLIDPESARFEWPYGLIQGRVKISKGGEVEGWLTCGFVNSKNRMGGYAGSVRVLIFGHQPDTFIAELGDQDDFSYADLICRPAVKKGLLPLAGSDGLAPVVKPLGFTYQATPIGSVVLGVVAGSSADAAGMKSGQIIETVNGISIKGLDASAQMAAVGAPADQLDFGLSNGSKLTVRRGN